VQKLTHVPLAIAILVVFKKVTGSYTRAVELRISFVSSNLGVLVILYGVVSALDALQQCTLGL